MLYSGSHPQLVRLLNWKVGYETDFRVSTGKASKYLKSYLPDEVWDRFLLTYIDGKVEDIWKSVFVMCGLFDETAREMEERWGYSYNADEAKAGYEFLKHVRELPKDAKEIF